MDRNLQKHSLLRKSASKTDAINSENIDANFWKGLNLQISPLDTNGFLKEDFIKELTEKCPYAFKVSGLIELQKFILGHSLPTSKHVGTKLNY